MSPARPAPPRPSLASLPVGAVLRVTDVAEAHAPELLAEGVLPGAVVRVASRTPLGGPMVVVTGRARIALSADVAAGVTGEPIP